MKTLSTKTGQQHRLNWAGIKKSSFFFTFVFVLPIAIGMSFVFSSSTPVPADYQEKKDDLANKKLMILEKLEAGKDLSSEEIRSSFDEFRSDGWESDLIWGIDFQEINKQLSESMRELKINIEYFQNSEEFASMHEDLRRWNEKFKEEFEKLMQEHRQSFREKKDPVPITIGSYRNDKNN